jgi:hypothetical protein
MTGIDIPRYVELYKSSFVDLTKRMPVIREYKKGSIQTTWSISFEEVRRKNPNAAMLLQLWAYFDSRDIWLELILNGNQEAHLPQWFQQTTKSTFDLLAALEQLLDFSLIQKNMHSSSFSVHPVVHDWLGLMSESNADELFRIALLSVAYTAPVDAEAGYLVLQNRLLPRADKLYYILGNPASNTTGEPNRIPNPTDELNLLGPDLLLGSDPQTDHPLRRLGWLFLELGQPE